MPSFFKKNRLKKKIKHNCDHKNLNILYLLSLKFTSLSYQQSSQVLNSQTRNFLALFELYKDFKHFHGHISKLAEWKLVNISLIFCKVNLI